jgi:ABC-type Mn2+/Zn2+ transport system permease subunit
VLQWLLEPFGVSFVRRALVAGVLVSLVCALVGTWVVLRGMAFLGDAVSHGLLPGVALASLTGQSILLGAAVSAGVMVAGIALIGRSPQLSRDTAIGLLFVGMLSVGVIVVSHSDSFAVDLTGFLFGDVLAGRPTWRSSPSRSSSPRSSPCSATARSSPSPSTRARPARSGCARRWRTECSSRW